MKNFLCNCVCMWQIMTKPVTFYTLENKLESLLLYNHFVTKIICDGMGNGNRGNFFLIKTFTSSITMRKTIQRICNVASSTRNAV